MSENNVYRNLDTDSFYHIYLHKIPMDNFLYKIKYIIKYHENIISRTEVTIWYNDVTFFKPYIVSHLSNAEIRIIPFTSK